MRQIKSCMRLNLSFYLTFFLRSIDQDILNLIDEVQLDKELKEAGEALVDSERFPSYIRQKSASAVSKFLVSATFWSCIQLWYYLTSSLSHFSIGLFTTNVNTYRKTRYWRGLGHYLSR